MTKIIGWFKKHLPTKRRLIQLYAALLFNANLKGYISGDIFKGITKNACTPGLNCYSCPGAVTACPLGALQNAFAASEKRAPYYMLGIIMLYGLMIGRWICGFLCPFGLVQDLLYKFKTPKVKKSKLTKVLSYFKYVILAVFVVILPLIYAFRDFPLPAFCKYICPAGTLGGAVGLLINPGNSDMFGMLGPLFTWKFVLMISIVVGCVFLYRLFCRVLCPLGALYGIFNRFSILGIKLEKNKCVNCGKCIHVCKMDISHVGDHECINCGECISVCPTKAITWKGAKIILPDNEIEAAKTDEEKAAVTAKREKRTLVLRIVAAVTMVAVLAGAITYYNFIDKPPVVEAPPEDVPPAGDNTPVRGGDIGNLCFSYSLELVDGSGNISVNDEALRGKVVIINFWGTWCGPCKSELPYFNRIAEEYGDEVVVIAIHTDIDRESAPKYIADNYADSRMVFAYDTSLDGFSDTYYTMFDFNGSYPTTLVLDGDGVITEKVTGAVHYEWLVEAVEAAKSVPQE